MKAVILAGGYGKRLRPLTDTIPKPLVPVGNRPILEWQILWLKKCGVDSFVILTGYLSEKIVSYLDARKKKWGVEVEYSKETDPLGRGGALKNAWSYVKDEKEFLMLNGDNIHNIDPRKMALDGCIGALALIPLKSTWGVIMLKGDKVSQFLEKPTLNEYWMNPGVYLLSNKIHDYLPAKGDIETTTFVDLSKKSLLKGVKYPNVYWRGVDMIKDMEEVSDDIKNGLVFDHMK